MTHQPTAPRAFNSACNDATQPDWDKGGGLLPAIIQDSRDGRVLMLGYMNAQALAHTQDTGHVTFYSRSRQTLWSKGETSGNTLALVSIALDCDGDTLLIQARPSGPVCHLGPATCFDAPGNTAPSATAPSTPDTQVLAHLDALIATRQQSAPEESYVARLLATGIHKCAQKVGEEGVEVAIAGAAQSDEHLINESADLLFHTLVLLRARGLGLQPVLQELQRRGQPPQE